MKKVISEEIDLPFEIGETYVTKFQTGDKFKITGIRRNKGGVATQFTGIYEKHQDLGECPLNGDRLIPRKKLTGDEYELTECPHCKKLF